MNKNLLTALLVGTLAALAGCSSPSIITLNDGRELQTLDEPQFNPDTGFYEYEQLDGKRTHLNKDQVRSISDL